MRTPLSPIKPLKFGPVGYLLLCLWMVPGLASAHGAGSITGLGKDLDHAEFVVVGTIASIHAPLHGDVRRDGLLVGVATQPAPNLTFDVEQAVFGNLAASSLTLQNQVFAWPVTLVPYQEGVRCLLVLTGSAALLSVAPAGHVAWSRASGRDDLRKEVGANLIAVLGEEPPGLSQAELIYALSELLDRDEVDDAFSPYLSSPDALVRHAATAGLVCKNPTPQTVDAAMRDLEPLFRARTSFFRTGVTGVNGVGVRTFWIQYYDCLSGLPSPPDDKELADLWHWISSKAAP